MEREFDISYDFMEREKNLWREEKRDWLTLFPVARERESLSEFWSGDPVIELASMRARISDIPRQL